MDKTFLIVGGSSGIGAASARVLTEQGARAILVGRRADALSAVAKALPASRVHTITADVTNANDVDRMFCEALAWSPRIDMLVNGAGASFTSTIDRFPLDQWQRIVDTNLTSVFLCCRAAVPIMKKQGGGHIVNLASVAAKMAFPEWGPYCATKFALVGLSRALQEEVRADGIKVTLLYPGSVDTPLWETFPNNFDRTRMLNVDDVARAISYLAQQPAHMVVDELSLIYAGGVQ